MEEFEFIVVKNKETMVATYAPADNLMGPYISVMLEWTWD